MARQVYKTSGNEEYVIVGNDVLMRCNIPSFVADFVSVVSWEDSEGREFHAQSNHGKWCKEYFKDDRGKKLQPIEQNLVLASFSNCHIYLYVVSYFSVCYSMLFSGWTGLPGDGARRVSHSGQCGTAQVQPALLRGRLS